MEPELLVFTSWGFHFFMASVRMANSVEWSPAAKKGTEKRRSRKKKKICKLCKVMQLETTRLHLLAPLHSCASTGGCVEGEAAGTGRFFPKRPAFEMTAAGLSLSMSFGEMIKNKATGAVEIISP